MENTKQQRLLKIEELVRVEQMVTNSTILDHSEEQHTLLISCDKLAVEENNNYLAIDHVLVKIDTFIRSYKIRYPNCKVIIPLLITSNSDESFRQRLNQLGVSLEMKENIFLINDSHSQFAKFTKLFSDICLERMVNRNQIRFNFGYPHSYILKMYLQRPYPFLISSHHNIIVGAQIFQPEHVFGVSNIWVNEKDTYGVYKMNNSNDMIIVGTDLARLLLDFGFIESSKAVSTVSGSSLLGCSVSFRGSTSDKLFILPSPDIDTIIASVPSQVESDYASWLNLQKTEWKSYADYCSPIPFLSVPYIGDKPSIYLHENPTHTVNRSHTEFINIEEILNLVHNDILPTKFQKSSYESNLHVILALDETFDEPFISKRFLWKMRFATNERNASSLRDKIVDWLENQQLALFPVPLQSGPYTNSNVIIRLGPNQKIGTIPVLKNSNRPVETNNLSFPIRNSEQVLSLQLKEKFLGRVENNASILLCLIFRAMNNNSADITPESVLEHLDINHSIWNDILNSSLAHYQFVSCLQQNSLSKFDYLAIFPKLEPTIVFTPRMIFDGMRMPLSNNHYLQEREIMNTYSTSAYRMSIIDGTTEEPSFHSSTANMFILSLCNLIDILQMQSSTETTIEQEEMDIHDAMFVELSTRNLVKARSSYSSLNFRNAVFNGWFNMQQNFKEYTKRKNLIRKQPNMVLVKDFYRKHLRIIFPIIPDFTMYCWNNVLHIEEPIFGHDTISSLTTNLKCLLAEHLLKQITSKLKQKQKRKSQDFTITVCDKRQHWQLKSIDILKKYEASISSQKDYRAQIVNIIRQSKDDFKDIKLLQVMQFICGLSDLYEDFGPEIFNDWNEFELIEPHIEWIKEQSKFDGYQINLYLERTSENSIQCNPFYPAVTNRN